MVVFKCDGSFEGIFTAIFDAWKCDDVMIEVESDSNMVLYGDFVEVITDINKFTRVAKGLRKISEQAYYMAYLAAVSSNPDRADALYGFVKKCFMNGPEGAYDYHDKRVAKVNALFRNTEMEFWHYRGFLRFVQYDKFLLAKYDSDNDIIHLLADHFQDRLLQENFIIVDVKRQKAAVHRANEDFFISDIDINDVNSLKETEEETLIRRLYAKFTDTIGIESRRNERLQRQNMPLRYRKYM